MGIFKIAAKVAGSAALVATGTASGVLKTLSDAAGIEFASELLDSAKNASFEGIKSMWSDNYNEKRDEYIDRMSESSETVTRRKMADTAYSAAQLAKQNGNMEKYEAYMEKYYEYKE